MISRLRIAISAVYALTVILVSAETPSKPRVALVVGNAKYDAAIELAPADAYPFYNRGRAYLALGKSAEAKADFTTAADPKFKQPGARKLAMKALSEFP